MMPGRGTLHSYRDEGGGALNQLRDIQPCALVTYYASYIKQQQQQQQQQQRGGKASKATQEAPISYVPPAEVSSFDVVGPSMPGWLVCMACSWAMHKEVRAPRAVKARQYARPQLAGRQTAAFWASLAGNVDLRERLRAWLALARFASV
eukprot:1157151-Pelagomonas_calceolata.AAC.8